MSAGGQAQLVAYLGGGGRSAAQSLQHAYDVRHQLGVGGVSQLGIGVIAEPDRHVAPCFHRGADQRQEVAADGDQRPVAGQRRRHELEQRRMPLTVPGWVESSIDESITSA